MIKEYPYLLNSYYETLNQELSKQEFLISLNDLVNQHQYVKMTLLDWDENPIKDISGDIVSGSITKDGNSQVRRTCSLSCQISGGTYNVENLRMDFSINKKIFLEIGIRNDTDYFEDYDILWFPQGIFFISDFSINSSSSASVGISLTLKDKIGMLDGTIGGIIPATTILDEEDTQIGSTITSQKVLIYDLITELVNHFGKEDLDKIIIEDVPRKIKRVMRWLGDGKCYVWKEQSNNNEDDYTYHLVTDDDLEYISLPTDIDYDIYEYGQDIGYVYDNFVYDQELTVTAGTTVANVLDTIKNYLGNYEYFYDEFGVFHFREIKNYLNNSLSSSIMEDTNYANGLGNDDYLSEINISENVFDITDKDIVSITSSPQYGNIKNDFIVQGTRKATNSDISYDVRYHVAIDEKPEINQNGYDGVLLYIDDETGYKTLCIPQILSPEGSAQIYSDGEDFYTNTSIEDPSLPEYGELGVIYGLLDEKKDFSFTKKMNNENYIKDKINNQELNDNTDITEDDYKRYYEYLLSTLKVYDTMNDDKEYEEIIESMALELKYILDNIKDFSTSDEDKELINKYVESSGIASIKEEDIFKSINYITNDTTELMRDGFNLTINDENIIISESMDEKIKNSNIENEIDDVDKLIDYYSNSLIPLAEKIYANSKNVLEKCDESNENYTTYYNNNKADKEYLEYLNNILSSLRERRRYLWNWWYSIQKDIDDDDVEYDIEDKTYKAFQTSFYKWTNDGWKEIEWIKYYSTFSYNNYAYTYPLGIGSYKYFEYEESDFENYVSSDYKTWPTNNIQSKWYQKYKDNSEKSYPYKATEWRTEIILQGLQSIANATDDASYYYEELIAMWPTMYDFENQKFYAEEKDSEYWHQSLTDGNYYLDFIDPSSAQVGEFCIDNIGRRTYVDISEDINCLFEPEIPDMIFIDIDNTTSDEIQEIEDTLLSTNEKEMRLHNYTFSNMATGGMNNAAYDQIKYDLLTHTTYQKTVSITMIPMFFLEPNTRINIDDSSTGTYGDFIVSSISIPLGPGNQMSISCSEVFEKI